MDYTKIYKSLILDRLKLKRSKYNGIYFENHHIIPKCVGGSNHRSNLVLLTAREHFISHKLLIKIYQNESQLVYALWRLSHCKITRYKLNSKEYDKLKSKISKIHSIYMSGPNNPMFGVFGKNHPWHGKHHTERSKRNIGKAKIGKNYGVFGKNHPWHGKHHTEESKLKMRNSLSGINNRLYNSEPWENPKSIKTGTILNWYNLDLIYEVWLNNKTLGYVNFSKEVLKIYPNLINSKTSFKNIRLWFLKNGNPTYNKHWIKLKQNGYTKI